MPDVECWDEERDARLYAGPYPIVAHPPCGPWGKLRHLCTKQDPGLALAAAAQVMRWGGVLEHPAGSRLWDALRLPKPDHRGHGGANVSWDDFVMTVEVGQVRWGHKARKRTWLLICGKVDPVAVVHAARAMPPREPTAICSGSRNPKDKGFVRGLPVLSAQQRRRTPPAFARWLVDLAAQAQTP
jgi:hypothetical protein